MKKWIRWWGIIAFIAVLILIILVWYLLADKIIANRIEKVGENIFGAKVDITDTDLTLIPLGLEIGNLQVANYSSPMKNLVELDSISFRLNSDHLLNRKTIIEEMLIGDIKFNTARKRSGAIRGGEPIIEYAYDDLILPIFDRLKIQTFIEEENLQSIDKLKEVLIEIKRVNKDWDKIYKTTPKISDIEDYNKRAKSIIADVKRNKLTGLIKNAGAIKQLTTDINSDREKIDSDLKAMQTDINSLQNKKQTALQAINNDRNHLTSKYTPDSQGLRNFSKYLFKNDILLQIKSKLNLYNISNPYLQYAYQELRNGMQGSESILNDGIDVLFPELNPMPEFLIKHAQISMDNSIGKLTGELNNFTRQQNLSGKPISISLSGKNLDFAKTVNVTATINRINKHESIDELSVSIDNQQVTPKSIKIKNNWILQMEHGLVDRKITVGIHNGKISGNLKFDYSGVSLKNVVDSQENQFISKINSVLSNIADFYLNVNISGTVSGYETKISSNIDNLIDSSVRDLIRVEVQKIENIINEKVDSLTEELTVQIEEELEKLLQKYAKYNEISTELKKILLQVPLIK